MNIIILKKIVFLIPGLFLVSCSQKNIEIDLSNLPKPKITNTVNKGNKQSINLLDKEYISDLAPLKDKEKDIYQDLKLTGFLNTQLKKYVFVNYLGKEGTISEKSIGGVNTNLLPEGAKVIQIDTNSFELTINHENENFVFEL